MKLSVAIREGAKLRPQGFGRMFELDPRVPEELDCVASCSLGAAYEAQFNEYHLAGITSLALYDPFPVLAEKVPMPCDCPPLPAEDEDLRDIIIHLNDSHEWTRERVADWVEKIEAQPAAA